MKFIVLALALVAAQDEEAPAALDQDADCSAEGSMCADGLCCGTATPTPEDGAEADPEANKTVCNGMDATDWTDAEDEDTTYTFACNMAEGASNLALGAALIASTYMLA